MYRNFSFGKSFIVNDDGLIAKDKKLSYSFFSCFDFVILGSLFLYNSLSRDDIDQRRSKQ